MIDLTIRPEALERNLRNARENGILIPTFRQMKHPDSIPEKVKEGLRTVGLWDVNPLNLFRIVPRSYTAMVVAVGTLLVSLIPDLILINL